MPLLCNMYGTSETTVHSTFKALHKADSLRSTCFIGERLLNTRTYVLDKNRRPVPFGVIGELYISGRGVARGYLNRSELTRERFFDDLYSDCIGTKMYRTGDLVRFLPDNGLEFIGRDDHQVKIRGYRIELSEIEACLRCHEAVSDARVLVIGDDIHKRLVAYIVGSHQTDLEGALRSYVRSQLPEFMVPVAIMIIDEIPLTHNGKVDLKALPSFERHDLSQDNYEAPRGEVELTIAAIWKELFDVKDVSRHDSFFALGGHSLLAIRMIERMRRHGFRITINDLYVNSTLFELAIATQDDAPQTVLKNLIERGIPKLTPEMLPLIDLIQTDIDCIVSQVHGGIDNIQDIYALSPLQDGMMFHHLIDTETDPYLLINHRIFSDSAVLERYISAMRRVINRHDALRTAFFWKNLSTPAQVVLREVVLPLTEETLDPDMQFDCPKYCDNLYQPPFDLQQAPLIRLVISRTIDDEWLLREVIHHIIIDNVTMDIINAEINAICNEREESLPRPTPFRNFIAHIRSSIRPKVHEEFFTIMLSDIDEPTLCFDLASKHADVSSIVVSQCLLSYRINNQLRRQAGYFNTTLATLCHLAWGLVVSKLSRKAKLVFGTVLFGRMATGSIVDTQVGLYINTLPIKLVIDGTPLNDCVRQTHHRMGELIEHENASLVMAQRCSRIPNGTPLFNSLLNYRHHVHRTRTDDMIPGIRVTWARAQTHYPLTVCVDDTSTELTISSLTAKPVDSDRVCAYMQRALESIAESLTQEPEKSINSLQVLPDSERHVLLKTWNTVHMSTPDSVCIHQLFEKQVNLTPTQTALIRGDEKITYAELNTRANRLAHHLIELGVKPECLIGLCVSPSFAMIVGLLAIHKAGGAYMPLDSSYPKQRLVQMVEDTGIRMIVADEKGADQLTDLMTDTMILINPNDRFDQASSNPIVRDLSRANLAYVIYTSGSTGQPKGVMVEHCNIVRLFETTEPLYGFNGNDIWCLVHSISFDFSVWEVWGALRYGGLLVIMSREEVRSNDDTFDLVCKHKVSVLCQSTSQFIMFHERLLVKPVRDNLRTIIFGGESLDATCLRSFYDKRADPVPQLYNMYGPTEVTVYATFQMLHGADTLQTASLIGKHLPDTHTYVLDENRHPAPLGVAGDLYVGSPRLARGYWKRPELTIDRFVPDSFSDSVCACMYKTGDLARFLSDGTLEFIGRDDQQVKLRGYRIDLREVEACFRSHEAVRDARVLMIGDDIYKRLVAYVVGNLQTDSEESLRSYAKSQLPEFMVPVAIMIIDEIPLNHNGKIDLRALPLFERHDLSQNTYEAPRGKVELVLADIWKELFDVEDVSRHDSFFALGGHSLLAIRMIERMRHQGYRITINDLYVNSTLSELAITALHDAPLTVPENLIERGIPELTPEMLPLIDLTQTDINHIVSQVPGGMDNIQDIYALSPLQDGILFHHVLNTETDPYLLRISRTISNMSILHRYISAMQLVIDRHDVLRTAFFWENLSSPAQVVFRKASLSVTEKKIDFSPELDMSTYDSLFHSETLDLHDAPLLRFKTAHRSDNSVDLGELLHHIIADHGTFEFMHAEIHALLVEQEMTLPNSIPFRNFIAHTRSNIRSEAHQIFFEEMLNDIDEPTLCFGLSVTQSDSSFVGESHRTLSCKTNVQLRRQATYSEVTPATLCHVAWGLVVSSTSKREKPVFGTVLFGRMNIGNATGHSMGLYINTLPIKLLIDDTPLIECVRRTHETLGLLLKHENAPLVMAQRCSRVPHGTALFNSILNYRHNVTPTKINHTVPGIHLIRAHERTNYSLSCSVDDDSVSIKISSLTAKPVDSDRVCAYMQRALESIAESLTQEPEKSINSLQVLPDSERHVLLKTWNTVHMSTPDSVCIHQLFEKQVNLTPTQTALIRGDEKITYAELNTRANRLAHHLIELGVKPECLIGLCVSPSFAMIVGLLAIHKAGGAYMPLDSSYPKQRLVQMVEDTGIRMIVADEKGADQLTDLMTDTMILINPNDRFDQASSNPIVRDLSRANLAYVIYTSGSTGQPKGVMVEHCNIVRLFETTEPLYGFNGNDIWCLVHSISFDFSVWEVWGALRYGGLLVIMSREEVRSNDDTFDLVCKHKVSVLCQSTSQFIMFHERLLVKPVRDNLRTIIFGGESLDATCLRSFYDKRADPVPQLYNMYGPTEVTVYATFQMLHGADTLQTASLIGKHLPDTHTYVLDENRHPAPLGVAGDLYVGSPRLARGYWKRPELTIDRFVPDSFSDSVCACMYKTGDLARFLSDGTLEFIGRDDQQVKLRGYRIDLREVEACFRSHEAVRDARVLMIGDDIYKRLVAYVVGNLQTDSEESLRSYAKSQLPEFMVPVAIMIIDEIPLNHNGKIDLRALPLFERHDLSQNTYEAPRGKVELVLADIWKELFDVEDVSRHDSFFALGGHSLLAIRMIERMRHQGYRITINDLYVNSTLSELAITALHDAPLTVPENLIERGIPELTPEMLPLIDLTQTDINHIVSQVPGGMDNIQDIYALSPLQDGILFHHVLNTETDPYLLRISRTISNMSILHRYISAMQLVIDRHDVLRTAFFWENLSSPAQVVFRKASLSVTEKKIDFSPELDMSTYDSLFHSETLDLHDAPLLRFKTAHRSDNSVDLGELLHHIIADHGTFEFMHAEIHALLVEQEMTLPNSIPFRNFIAHTRSNIRSEAHQIFFEEMLNDIDEPTLCFGLSVTQSDSSFVGESHRTLSCKTNVQLRRQATYSEVTPATLCHVAWGLVVSSTSKREKPVFGTVLFGRMNIGNATGHSMGLYINTLPIKLLIDDTPLIECVRRTHETLGLLLKHENAPLVMAQRCSRVPHGTALFNSILNYRHNVTPTKINHTVPGIHLIRAHERTNYSLSCSVDDDSVSIKISSLTAKPVDSDRVCAYMQRALESIAESLTQEPEKSINSLQVLPDSERHVLLKTWNTVHMSTPDSVCIHQLFEKQVNLTPTQTALIRGDEKITYAELNTRANRLAHHLIELGVKPECLIGLCVSPSFAMIVGLLAIHKAGGAYIPLDSSYPKQRLVQMVEDTGIRMIVADEKGADQLTDLMTDTMILINPNDRFDQASSNPIVRDLSRANLAYVIYTSGSTGQPKGVMVEHCNIVRLFETTEPLYGFNGNDIWCLVHSISFDFSVWEVWGALRYGGLLVIMSREEVRSNDDTFDLVCKHKVSVLCQSTSQFIMFHERLLVKPVRDNLRTIIFGGESLDATCLRSFYDKRADPVPQLYNMYGPTEVTVYATFQMLHGADTLQTASLIGKHLPDTHTYVLDENRHPAPLGVAGDLYVGSPRLARGYWKRPELTIDRFVPDSFSDSVCACMYKTGDLARFLSDGTLEFIGRDDQQVKLRGYRIDLREVEACFRSHEAVRDARVLMIGDDIYKRLVAYVVANHENGLDQTLHSHVRSQLPEFMVPVAIIIMNEIPLTHNGKVDLQALPSLGRHDLSHNTYEAPRGEIELTLAAVWEELLDVKDFSRHDSFFALGGHSLLAIRMIERMRHKGYRITINDLYVNSTLLELASTALDHAPLIVPENFIEPGISKLTPEMLPLIDITQTDIDCIVSQVQGGINNIQDIYALSPLQDGMMFHHFLDTGTDPYLLINHKIFSDFAVLQRYISAMRRVIIRHDVLRTAFFWKNLNTPAQVVLREIELQLAEETLGPNIQLDCSKYWDNLYRTPFDLQQAPLMRLVISRTSSDEWLLREVIHHIIIDNVTMEIINTEINAICNEREASLPRPTPFRNFIAHVRSAYRPEFHRDFFTNMLDDIDESTLCFDSAAIHADMSSVVVSQCMLSSETDHQLRRQAGYFNTTLATLCHLAWGLVASKLSRKAKLVFGTVLFGRMASSSEVNTQVGLYINTLPIKLIIDGTPLNDCVRQTHHRMGELLEHENASLVIAQRCSRIPNGTPLFNSLLNYRHHVHRTETDDMMPGVRVTWARAQTHYPLTVCVDDTSTELTISSQTAESVNSKRVCAYMQRASELIAKSLLQEPEKSINSLQVLPDNERQVLLETWNTVHMSTPDSVCIHQLFEKQVNLTPTKTALIREDEEITYAELNTRANRLAHQLIELGVRTECPIGLCVSPSFAMIVGLLAIHKAGGAYVPLDPSYPEERLVQMVEDTELRIIVADERGADQLRNRIADTLIFISPNDRFDGTTSNPIVRDLSETNLAYVIYTSGSTGQPKGVMVEHRNIVRLFETTQLLFRFSQNDVWCLGHSISFDFSVWEVWGALRYGGQLVIMSREEVRSMETSHYILCKYQVSVLCQTPSQFKMLNERLLVEPVRDHLQKIIFGGESLDATCLRSFFDRRLDPVPQFYNMYGPTETTVFATFQILHETNGLNEACLIGKHLPDTQLYLLDENRHPTPLGVVGNLYIGGQRLARGYWNRTELTVERFIVDPFSDSLDAYVYKTGDLAKFLPDGSLEYIGRDDHQVKIRGYRIELGEIEACFRSHEAVRDARVLLIGDDIYKRLVAYVVGNHQTDLEETLRSYAKRRLPEFMVPVAIMIIDEIPLTHNGKIDLHQLSSLERHDYSRNTYEAPRGEVELTLAAIWKKLFGIEDVSRHDSFFALGGHSLLAIRMIERMRHQGYRIGINDLYANSTLSELAITALDDAPLKVPENFIERGLSKLTPEMFPLIDLTQTDIDYIISRVPGGIDNLQDIYALSPLQDGILFHHMLNTETDPYLVRIHRTVSNISILERYITSMQIVINRHDVLRTAFFWENLSLPAQVVFREASLSVTEKILDSGLEFDMSIYNSLFQSETLDLHDAPLLRFKTARRSDNSWDLGELLHHIIADHETFEFMHAEIHALMEEQETTLPNSIPFRNFIAHIRSTIYLEAHQNFFEEMLSDIDEPTLCFGLSVAQSDSTFVGHSRRTLLRATNVQLRRQATHLDVTPATLCHVAWGLVVSSTSKQDKPVFGTVLFGRMNIGNATGHSMGLYINTLPITLLIGDTPLIECVRKTHEKLGHLMKHENAPLVMAQQCSRVPHGTPLFNSILNYRHSVTPTGLNHTVSGIHSIRAHERTNYPLTCSVDDDSVSIQISSLTAEPVNSERVCAYMQRALELIVESLTQEPVKSIICSQILPENERKLLLETWNTVDMSAPDSVCIHQLFEKQAILTPTRTALKQKNEKITYAELNTRANRLAHHLIELGVKPECLVGLCVSPSLAMIVGLLAIHKAGGAYVPLDSSYPEQRLVQMITDTELRIIVADERGAAQLEDQIVDTMILINPNDRFDGTTSDPIVRDLSQTNLAYVIYTSGTTGQPKGVMVEHRNIVRLFETTEPLFHFSENDIWCLVHSISFDFSVWEVWGALRYGGQLVIMSREEVRSVDETYDLVCKHQVSVLCQTPSQFNMLNERLLAEPIRDHLRKIIFGGESLVAKSLQSFYDRRADLVPQLYNMYGPTEATVYATFEMLHGGDTLKSTSFIGKHLSDTQSYVLDRNLHPAPLGVVGNLYVGGQRLARGYWNRPELTRKRFIVDPFSDSVDAHIYQTGDLAKFLPDGTLEYIGRDDQQVKIRGYRIELGEVEACLRNHEAVRDTQVLMIGDDIYKRLVAYVVANRENDLEQTLRSYMKRQLPEFMVPFAVIIIDEIPLTLNGKPDHTALPIPDSISVARSSYETPSTHTEWKLATIWSQLLGIDSIGRDDNFFHVGGHSLLAVRMISLVAEQGLACTLNDLFQYPVLRDLASRIEVDSEIQEVYSAIPVRRTGTEPALFFVPTGFGDYSYVFALSLCIQTSCPIYALPWPPSQEQPSSTMEETARKMIPLIKAVQPQGPYRICGYSSGGLLCPAIASQLHESGDIVAFVGLIDTTSHATDGTNRTQRRQLSAILDLLATIGLERVDDIVGLCKEFADMSFVELIEAGKHLKLYASNLRSEIHAQKLEQRVNFMEMVMSYVPEDLGIVIHQFNASELSKVEEYLSNQIDFLGDHVTMMENSENRLILGAAIDEAIQLRS